MLRFCRHFYNSQLCLQLPAPCGLCDCVSVPVCIVCLFVCWWICVRMRAPICILRSYILIFSFNNHNFCMLFHFVVYELGIIHVDN